MNPAEFMTLSKLSNKQEELVEVLGTIPHDNKLTEVKISVLSGGANIMHVIKALTCAIFASFRPPHLQSANLTSLIFATHLIATRSSGIYSRVTNFDNRQ